MLPIHGAGGDVGRELRSRQRRQRNGDLNAGHVVTLTVNMSEAVTVAEARAGVRALEIIRDFLP